AGRTLSPFDDATTPGHGNAEPVAVLSYAYWQRQFGGAADAIGRTLTLEGTTFTIVGVTPPRFTGIETGSSVDVIVPMGADPLGHRNDGWVDAGSLSSPFRLIVRMNPGATTDSISAGVRSVQPQIRETTIPPSWPAQARGQYLRSPFTFARA